MQNLLDLTPIRLRDFTLHKNRRGGDITVLVPKFGTGKIGNWLRKRLKNPDYRVHLDNFGSHVWQLCNGENRVRNIGTSLQEKFGDTIEPVYDRLALFLTQLEKSKLIAFREIIEKT